jgi:hypothetical protein
MKQKSGYSPKPLENGQIWQMDDLNIQIALVGKRLVHYKLFKGTAKRAPVSLLGKEALEQYLKANKGVLIRG